MNKILLTILLLLSYCVRAQVSPHPYLITKDSLPNYLHDNNWRFHPGDDMAMAQPGFDDSNWDIVRPSLRYSRNPKREADTFSSICWLRFHFRVDTSLVNVHLALGLTQYGASELYLDGRKIIAYGVIKGPDSTVNYDPQYEPVIFTIPDTSTHVLAVRCANYHAKINALRSYRDLAGFDMRVTKATTAISIMHWESMINTLVFTLLFGIFITFCIVHLFFYFFYRTATSNLYFSILCLCLATGFLLQIINRNTNNPGTELWNAYISLILLSVGMVSFSGFTNYLFSKSKLRFRIVAVIGLLTPFILLIQNKVGFLVIILLLVYVILEAIVITIAAIFRKVKGAPIIGFGILFCTLFSLSNLVFGFIHGSDKVNEHTLWGKIYLFLLAFAVLSMPLFMSIYLAWDYAFVNKGLKKQLEEVEKLSKQTLAQEQEKKHILETQNEMLEREVAARTAEVVSQHDELKAEKKKSDDLLLNILPSEVAEELKEKGHTRARLYSEVSVLFTDFVNFTQAGEQFAPDELVNELHTCFQAFDEIMAKHGVEKIKTIGDAYLAVCGLPEPSNDHAEKTVLAAMEIVQFMTLRRQTVGNRTFEVRVGIHSGSVVAGIVGVKKFAYDIWGDTVNTAARMEQNSEAGKINISQTTYDLISNKFSCTHRGKIQAKNKGELSMYFVDRKLQ